MKMINLSMPIALVAVIAVCFCAGCSDSPKLTGTAEETNEFAFVVSSSDEGAYSSSDELLSSSSEISSSSIKLLPGSSSSIGDVASSSSRLNNNSSMQSSAAESSSSMLSESSSSSLQTVSSSSLQESSSSMAPPQGGKLSSSSIANPNSLEYYIEELGLNAHQVYEGVMAAKSTEEKDSDTAPGQAAATEFDGPWPHRFVKQNIGALEYFFPNAADEYAGLIDSIKAGQAEDGCWLYMMNVYGNDKSVGYVLADVSENKVVVLDISAGECPNSAVNKTFRFLFRYCGVIATSPEIEHVEVDLNVPEGSCPSFDSESEWVGTVN